jgi:hypothetical protein
MKTAIVIFLLIFFTNKVQAQIGEWFNQKNKQIEYLTQQIAALEIYKTYLNKGYTIVKGGLGTINDIKHGDLDLHTDYFNSLTTVNGRLKKSAAVINGRDYSDKIIINIRSIRKIAANERFTASEQVFITNVLNNLSTVTSDRLHELTQLLTNGSLQLTDDQRLEQLNGVCSSIKEAYLFSCDFLLQTKILAGQKEKDSRDIQTIKKLNAIQP